MTGDSVPRRVSLIAVGMVIAVAVVWLWAGGTAAGGSAADLSGRAHQDSGAEVTAEGLSGYPDDVSTQSAVRSSSGAVDLSTATYSGSEGLCHRVMAVPTSDVGGSALGGCLGEIADEKVPRTWGFGSLTAGGEVFTVYSGFSDASEVGSVVVTLTDGTRLTAAVVENAWSIIQEGASDESGAELVSIEFLSPSGNMVETVDVQAQLAAARAASPEGPSH